MPATAMYNYQERNYHPVATCSTQGCDARVEGPPMLRYEAARYIESGSWTEAAEVFGLDNRTGRPRSVCRRCNAERARARRERLQVQGVSSRPRRGSYVPADARRFGVEIELIYPRGRSRSQIEDALRNAGLQVDTLYNRTGNAWSVKTDGSLTGGNGYEVVSPPLQGQDGHDQLAKACRALQSVGGKPNRSCGLHVHHEIRDIGIEGLRRFIRGYAANIDLIDSMLAPSRRGHQTYTAPWSTRELERLEGCTTMEQVGHGAQGGRYRNVNLQSYPRYGTVEIRQHQGSVNATKISSWVRLIQSMIDAGAREQLATQRSVLGLVRAARTDDDTAAYMIGRAALLGAGAGGE